MTTTEKRYQIAAPDVPGGAFVTYGPYTLTEARRHAREDWSIRRDLTYQDVRIERVNPAGVLVEYAGPTR